MDFFVPTIKDMKEIKDALNDNKKRCCEMSPANTVLWAKHYNTEIAFWEGNLIFRSNREKIGYVYSCNLLSAEKPKQLFDRLVELAKEEGQRFCMYCVMEEEMELIEGWYPGVYQMTYNRDESDYIYMQERSCTEREIIFIALKSRILTGYMRGYRRKTKKIVQKWQCGGA